MNVRTFLARLVTRPRRFRLIAIVAVLLLSGLGPPPGARAATLCVDPSGANGCYVHIQDAINAASDQATINVAAGTYSEHLTLSWTRMVINGAGSSATFVDGTGSGRVIYIPIGNDEIVTGMTIRNGNDTTNQGGGGIYNYGDSLTLGDVILANNVTTGGGQGGAIYNNGGALNLANVSLTGNTAAIGAGGVYNGSGGILTVTNATFDSNVAETSGAIDNYGEMTLTDVTISANHASQYGAGGIATRAGSPILTNVTFSGNSASVTFGQLRAVGALQNSGSGTLTLTNVTISGNTATGAGASGVYNTGGALALKNTIVVSNQPVNCSGPITSQGHNLSTDSTCISTTTGPGDLVVGDPKLGPLQNNGGPTQTMALLPYSPAIDAGDNFGCPATDQRGIARPQGKSCDIGAYEFVAPTLALSPPTLNLVIGTGGTATVTIGPSEATDTVVALSSANAGVATVPSSVTILAGQTGATFTVTGVAPGGPVTISANLPAGLGGTVASMSVTVSSPSRLYLPSIPDRAPGL